MRAKCRAFFKLKGVFQPTCSHDFCWGEWFNVNIGKYHAARRAFTEMGEETLAEGQRIMLNREFPTPRPKAVDVFIEAQVGRFVTKLKRRVREDEKVAG